MTPDPRDVAARLGLDETIVRRLEARGLLSRLALDKRLLDERLRRAFLDPTTREGRGPR